MKKFESILDAMRFIKSELPKVEDFDTLYIMWNSFSGQFYVSDNDSELEEAIEEDWYNSGCEVDPERHAEEFKVWVYAISENKEKYPAIYRGYKPSIMSKGHIRGTGDVGGEVVARFSVSRY